MEVYDQFGAREVVQASWAILKRGSFLCLAIVKNMVPQMLVSIFAGHMSGLAVFDKASLFLLIDALLGSVSCAYAIGSVRTPQEMQTIIIYKLILISKHIMHMGGVTKKLRQTVAYLKF